ncbi:alpha/beta fold hydrolase [Nocardioides nitrophenolicus]|uniref:alpha/beta fold hydrolase n=1 Tax=Nocardioides nitrophenolicus TaxID=60489 RepID=UPI0019581C4B|nr:alpha/beta fold hydrolase [Nocardioides nitrophenolicus]MBM7518559.1 3-oxoadipate enol-lactonase [Nocardioides nitrophenolicus]
MHLHLDVSTPPEVTDAPWLVLGHSLGTSSALWTEVRALLADRFRTVAWDLPGHGRSAPAPGPFTVGDLADALVDGLRERGIDDFRYAGVSLGGTVGIDLAVRHADRARAVTVISSGISVDAPGAWVERADAVVSGGTDQLVAGSLERWFAPTTHARRPSRVAELIAALRAADDASYAFACRALAAYDATGGLGAVDVPLLAVWGEHDRLVPEPKSAELAAAVRHGSLASVSGAAHAAPLEQPEAVADLLDTFPSPRSKGTSS